MLNRVEIDGSVVTAALTREVNRTPKIQLTFSAPVNKSKVASSITLEENAFNQSELSFAYLKNDSVVVLAPTQPLKGLTKYQLNVGSSLTAAGGATLSGYYGLNFHTGIDSSNKFELVSDN